MEKALIAYLIAQGIAAGRVYPFPPQGVAFPYVALTRAFGGIEYADDGDIGLERPRIQIDCRALTYGEAKDLAASVKAVLSGVRDLVYSGVTFPYIMILSERDQREPGLNATSYIFTVNLDLDVWNVI